MHEPHLPRNADSKYNLFTGDFHPSLLLLVTVRGRIEDKRSVKSRSRRAHVVRLKFVIKILVALLILSEYAGHHAKPALAVRGPDFELFKLSFQGLESPLESSCDAQRVVNVKNGMRSLSWQAPASNHDLSVTRVGSPVYHSLRRAGLSECSSSPGGT